MPCSRQPRRTSTLIDPRTGQIELFDLEDQVDFEIAEFNKKVFSEAFNKAVA